MNIKKLFKTEKGTGKTKVPVHRKSGIKMEYRRTGKKESQRTGTGKMNKFPESVKRKILEERSFGTSGAKIKDFIESQIGLMSEKDQKQMEDLGLIHPKKLYGRAEIKLTITPQALTDWARKQGVESTKKRTSAVDAEKVKHEDTKNELDRADKKIVRLEIEAKSKNEVLQLVQQSKQESDKIRQQLGKDNLDLKSKLKSCLGDKK